MSATAPPPAGSPGESRPDPTGPGAQQVAPAPPKRERAVSVGQILAGILLVVVVIFVVENTGTVKVRLIGPEVHAPLAVALLIAAVLGALVAGLMRYRRRRHADFKAEAKAARAQRKGRA